MSRLAHNKSTNPEVSNNSPAACNGDDTLPKLLLRKYHTFGDTKVAWRKKDFGIWQEYTWKDCYDKVKAVSLGLMGLGLKSGDHVSILGDNNPEWYWAELATQAAGAVVTGLFPDNSPDEVQYILADSEARFAVVQDQEQLDKLLQVKENLPLLQKVIYWDAKGLRKYDSPIIMSFDQLVRLGMDFEKEHPTFFEEMVSGGKASDLYMIVYTSGTTGLPKGAMLTHAYVLSCFRMIDACMPFYETDEYVSTTLPGWFNEQIMGLTASLVRGQKFNFAEEAGTVQLDIREIGPHRLLYPSTLWEHISATIQSGILDANWFDRFTYKLAMPVGYRMADMALAGEKPGLLWQSLHAIAELVVFRPIRQRHGLARVRIPTTGGSMIGPDTIRFLWAVGIKILNGYGCTETPISNQTQNQFKFNSVGIPNPGKIIRISDQGEMLLDSEVCFSGYYGKPKATETALRDGWYHTGDAGRIDKDGHVIFVDRLENMRMLKDGTEFSPQYLECSLKFSPYIKDVIVIGGQQREFVIALVNIAFDTVARWAEKRRIPYTTFADLSQRREVLELIAGEIQRANLNMASKNLLIRCFANFAKEFDPDEAELTRSRKLRRTFLEDRYKNLVEALYSGHTDDIAMETSVRYRDGTTRMVNQKIIPVYLDDSKERCSQTT